MASANGVGIEFFEFVEPRTETPADNFPWREVGVSHICVLDPEIDDLVARIEESGGRMRTSRVREVYEGDPYRWVYCEDPFGNVVEIYSHSHEQVHSNRGLSGSLAAVRSARPDTAERAAARPSSDARMLAAAPGTALASCARIASVKAPSSRAIPAVKLSGSGSSQTVSDPAALPRRRRPGRHRVDEQGTFAPQHLDPDVVGVAAVPREVDHALPAAGQVEPDDRVVEVAHRLQLFDHER